MSLGYTHPSGLPELRQEISNLYSTVMAEHVIVSAPQELISMASLAMLRPGDHMVVTFPGYQSLYEIARTLGAEVNALRALCSTPDKVRCMMNHGTILYSP